MKIWIITTDDDNGTQTAIHYTAEAANAQAVEIVTAWYDRHLRADQEPREHTDWQETYELLSDTIGFNNYLTFEEHDISAHPAIAKAIAAYDLMQDAIQESEDAACNDETVALMESGYVLVRAALGLPVAQDQADDDAMFGISPELLSQVETDIDREEAAYRAAAIRLHHRDGEIEINDNADVSLGDDPGAYVQAWVWVSAEAAGIDTDDEGEDE
jgi:hypothetical protein